MQINKHNTIHRVAFVSLFIFSGFTIFNFVSLTSNTDHTSVVSEEYKYHTFDSAFCRSRVDGWITFECQEEPFTD